MGGGAPGGRGGGAPWGRGGRGAAGPEGIPSSSPLARLSGSSGAPPDSPSVAALRFPRLLLSSDMVLAGRDVHEVQGGGGGRGAHQLGPRPRRSLPRGFTLSAALLLL